MIQIIIMGVGLLAISFMLSTPEQRAAARADIKRIEPYALAVIVGGVGFVAYAWFIG